MVVILGICLISLVCICAYTVVKAMNSDNEPKVVHAPQKAEPTIMVTVNLYDKHQPLEGTRYQVPLSQAAFYIPNFKDTLVCRNSEFVVREVKRDLSNNTVSITAYKAQ